MSVEQKKMIIAKKLAKAYLKDLKTYTNEEMLFEFAKDFKIPFNHKKFDEMKSSNSKTQYFEEKFLDNETLSLLKKDLFSLEKELFDFEKSLQQLY